MNRLLVKSVMLRVKDVAGNPRCVSSWIPCGGRARIDSKLVRKGILFDLPDSLTNLSTLTKQNRASFREERETNETK